LSYTYVSFAAELENVSNYLFSDDHLHVIKEEIDIIYQILDCIGGLFYKIWISSWLLNFPRTARKSPDQWTHNFFFEYPVVVTIDKISMVYFGWLVYVWY